MSLDQPDLRKETGNPEAEMQHPKSNKAKYWLIGGGLFAILFYFFCGFYTVQPIGALPDGSTAIVWRTGDEPFFNSPDGTCLRRTGSVSLMCRGMAMGDAPIDRIILRLPYIEFAYSMSTDGREFDR